MANQVMRITLKAYDHQLVDASAKKIIETVERTGTASYKEGSCYDPACRTQVQRFQRTVRASYAQETDRYHYTHTQDR